MVLGALVATAGPAQGQEPLSVIDWLQDTLGTQDSPADRAPDQQQGGPQPVSPGTGDAWVDNLITMRPIGAPSPEAAGLFPAERADLPRDLWAGSRAEEIAALMRGLPMDTLPALRALALALLLAEFDPPMGRPVTAPSPATERPDQDADRDNGIEPDSFGGGRLAPWIEQPVPGAAQITGEGPHQSGPENTTRTMSSDAAPEARPDPPSQVPARPHGAGDQGSPGIALVKARVDRLIAFGALDQAGALLELLSSRDPALRARAFDIALLLGEEHRVCDDVLHGEPPFPGLGGRIFCLARAGRWPEATRLWEQGREAGALSRAEAALLERFLEVDDDLHHEERLPEWLRDDLTQPQNLSALSWRLLEAIGAPVASHGLPVAFAHADLRGTIGWRAQLEAAERLVRSGALPPNRLLGLYTERRAAASGGIWERVRAIARLEAALSQGNADAIASALASAWRHIGDAELETAFAALYASSLLEAPLTGEAALLAATIGLLDADPAPAAMRLRDGDARARFLAAIAQDQPPQLPARGTNSLQRALAEALAEPLPALPEDERALLAANRGGEALLISLAQLGGEPDPHALGRGLLLMRHLGLDNAVRASALQALLLERHG